MTDNSDERRAKIYALHLLNRLGKPFDVREVNNLAALIPLVEDDIADWLAGEMVGTASRTLTVSGVRAGKHRPPYELKDQDGAALTRHNGDGSIREGEPA